MVGGDLEPRICAFAVPLTYLALALAGLACALPAGHCCNRGRRIPNWSSIVPATILVGIGASLFLPLKYAIPRLVPFWLDAPLANAERAMFAADPWLILDHSSRLGNGSDRQALRALAANAVDASVHRDDPAVLGDEVPRIDRLCPRLVHAGRGGRDALSSAGPIFYDRIFGGTAFAALRETLQDRGAWLVLAESDRMWASLASVRPGLAAGISAVPPFMWPSASGSSSLRARWRRARRHTHSSTRPSSGSDRCSSGGTI